MMPWDWIGIETIRMGTRCRTTANAMITRSPGSRGPRTRPSRNSTPCWYCLTTLIASASPTASSSRTMTTIMITIFMGAYSCAFSAVREPGPPGPPGSPGLPSGQVVDEQEDGGADDGGDPGGQVEEPVQGVDVEQLGGRPAAAERPDDADQAGQDEGLRSSAGDQHIGEQARGQSENDPSDDAHNRLL